LSMQSSTVTLAMRSIYTVLKTKSRLIL